LTIGADRNCTRSTDNRMDSASAVNLQNGGGGIEMKDAECFVSLEHRLRLLQLLRLPKMMMMMTLVVMMSPAESRQRSRIDHTRQIVASVGGLVAPAIHHQVPDVRQNRRLICAAVHRQI